MDARQLRDIRDRIRRTRRIDGSTGMQVVEHRRALLALLLNDATC